MKTEKFDGEIANAYGKALSDLQLKEGATPLSGPLKYETSYEAFETMAELKDKNEFPNEKEIVDFVNAKRKANARQKAMQATLDAAGVIKPTIENDDQLKLKKMYDIFIAAKNTHEEARAKASAALGIDWADDK